MVSWCRKTDLSEEEKKEFIAAADTIIGKVDKLCGKREIVGTLKMITPIPAGKF
jgi:hypothetical protein